MKPKAPKLALRVLHVTTAGRSIVKVVPQRDSVTIGTETWKVTRAHIWPGKGPFDVAVVSGQSEAVPVWERSPISATEYDRTAHDNLLQQIRDLAQGGRSNAINWLQVGLSALVVLSLAGVGFTLHGDQEDLKELIEQTHVLPGAQQGNGDSTTVHEGQQGSLGRLQEQQGSGPP